MSAIINGCARWGFSLILGITVLACTDDYNTPCDFPESPEISQYCGSRQDEYGNESYATCVDVLNPDCQTLICVRYQGSDPFCSERCEETSDCPPSSICEYPTGSSFGVCVPDNL